MRRTAVLSFLLGLLATFACAQAQQPSEAPAGPEYVIAPDLVLTGIPTTVEVKRADGLLEPDAASIYRIRVGGVEYSLELDDGALVAADVSPPARGPVTVELLRDGEVVKTKEIRSISGFLSIVPPLLAILMALLFRRVIPALFLGLWSGAWIVNGATGIGSGVLDSFQVYVRNALVDADHVSIVLFTFMIGGMVGIISRSGGTQGVVDRIVRFADTARRGQLSTAVLGLVVFFDDYANTLVVGNTMRPVTDRLKISREKLAFIVDSTAAPVSCLAFVTTWIGYEVGVIGEAVGKINGYDEAAVHSIFLGSIPYSFYPILMIFFVFAVATSRRDFGPMHAAERRANAGGNAAIVDAGEGSSAADASEFQAKKGAPARAINAILPVLVLIFGVLIGLFVTGEGDSIREIIGGSDSYAALMWASLSAVLVASALAIGQRILDLEEIVEAWYSGVRSMLLAMIILVLAWSLSSITDVLHTADYLVSVLGDALPAGAVPAIVFVISAATAFATGSSWGTMGILMPLVIPLTWAVLQVGGTADADHYFIVYSTVSCVLAGSVWGDHCSPISDTTILSSMASGCDHIEHVRTQIPYALTVGSVALLVGTLPTGFGFPWWASLLLGAGILALILRIAGRRADAG